MVEKKNPSYIAVVGLTLKNGDRVEPGDVFPGSPPKWLIDQKKVKKGRK